MAFSSTTSDTVDTKAPLPVLQYDAPVGFNSSVSPGWRRYTSMDSHAWVHIYKFRRYTGDIALAFRADLLRDWIDPEHRETNVVARPIFGRDNIRGARAVLTARFIEAVARRPKEHIRFLVVVGDAAALIDVSAASAEALQHVAPALTETFSSMRVETQTQTSTETPTG
jgi:hypothetical protein